MDRADMEKKFEEQLEHIHKQIIQQQGAENLLKLTEAEMNITRMMGGSKLMEKFDELMK